MSQVFHAGSKTWEINTTGTVTTDRVKIKNIRWVGATAAGHVCEIQDGNGGSFFKSTAMAIYWDDEQLMETWFNGISVLTIDSGTLYIIYE